jgi:hypothetical protein
MAQRDGSALGEACDVLISHTADAWSALREFIRTPEAARTYEAA